MKTSIFFVLSLGLALAMPLFVFGQKTDAVQPSKPLLKRVVTKSDRAAFGAGGTISVVGAPVGSVTVIGWNKNEVEISADIELQAETEADLAMLAQVNDAVLDPGTVHLSVLTLGVHDKDYMKKKWKKFPKRLLSLPWKVDYVIHVPSYTDIDVAQGKGALKVSGIDGSMLFKATEVDADLQLIGGMVNATFGSGTVNLQITSRSWRGRNLVMNMAAGNLNVTLPADFNADIDASVIRNGEILSTYAGLKPREERNKFTPKNMNARAGNGGAMLNFVMGDGTVKFSEASPK